MRPAGGRVHDGQIGKSGFGSTRYLIGPTIQLLLIAAFSGGLFWLVWIYASALRDPRYLDGWVLAGGMSLQLCFHVAVKRAGFSPSSAKRWRRVHILVGYLLIAVFAAHSDFSSPKSGLGLALWTGFVLVTLSGILGTYLAWSLRTRHRIDDSISYDRIPARRAELARNLRTLLAHDELSAQASALPEPSYGAWINDLYTMHLRDFFDDHRNLLAHLIGSQRPLRLLTDEIGYLSRYVDAPRKEKLAAIENLVIEKNRLDFAQVRLGIVRGLQFVHVPVTYAVIVLTVLHVLVVYAFSFSSA